MSDAFADTGEDGKEYDLRAILNKLKWHHEYELSRATIIYTHRGAPGDVAAVDGEFILEINPSFFVRLSDGMRTHIPYHRIQRIEYDGEPIFDRGAHEAGDGDDERG